MAYNTTAELRELYFQQSQYSTKQVKPDYPLFLNWPEKGYFNTFKSDAELLQKAISPLEKSIDNSVAERVFGNLKQNEYLDLRHAANLFYERCRLHNQHIQEIDKRHIEIQEKKFGVEINNFPDRARRLSNLEGQLLQLENQRREEELAFWKDTVELRQKLFESAAKYKAVSHRFSIFSGVEAKYDR